MFHKLSNNTKYVKFQLHMSLWWILFNKVCIFIFLYFLKSSYMQPRGQNFPRAEREGAKKEVYFAHRILGFHFFPLFFFFMVLCDVIFNETSPIWIWRFWFFSRNFTSTTMLEFWGYFVIKNHSSSLILINLKVDFKLCEFNLIQKMMCKRPKKEGRRPNFHEFRSEEVQYKIEHQFLIFLMFEHYNLVDPIE
jgi:hypothetical protein